MAINPTQALIDALKALRDSDPQESNIEQIIGNPGNHSIFSTVSGHFRTFIDAAQVDFAGTQARNIAAINSIIWLVNSGADELSPTNPIDNRLMWAAGYRFKAEYWLAITRETVAKLEAKLATVRLDHDSLVISLQERYSQLDNLAREHRKVCQQNDDLNARIAELEAELATRPPVSKPNPS